MKIKTQKEKETKKLAKKIAKSLTPQEEKATVLALSGELGSGKTTFTKGFAEEFGIKEITSPTFVIMKKYQLKNKEFNRLYHIDCYRIEEKTDLKEIKFEEILKSPRNLILIEWPERLINLPEGNLMLNFEVVGENERVIKTHDLPGLKKQLN